MQRKLHVWGDNSALQPESDGFDLITVATDGSLDEGDCVLRTKTGPSPLSGGNEFFVQLDGMDEIDSVLAALEVCADGGGDEVAAEAIARFAARLRRLQAYSTFDTDTVEVEVEAR